MQKLAALLKKNIRPDFPTHYRKAFIVIGIVAFILFVLFTLLVRNDTLRSFDFDTTVRLQDDVPVRFDEIFSFFSIIGRFEFTFTVLLIILFLKRKILGVAVIGFFGVAHIIEVIGKSILSQPGPPHMFLRTTDLSMKFPGLYVHTDASYPSGQAVRALFVLVIIFFILRGIKKLPAYLKYPTLAGLSIYTILMLLSRVSLGEHWTTDVIGGALLGISFAFLSLLFL